MHGQQQQQHSAGADTHPLEACSAGMMTAAAATLRSTTAMTTAHVLRILHDRRRGVSGSAPPPPPPGERWMPGMQPSPDSSTLHSAAHKSTFFLLLK